MVLLGFISVWKSLNNDPKHSTSDYCFPVINQLQTRRLFSSSSSPWERSGKLSSGFWKWSILFSCFIWSPHGGHTFQTWASLSQPKSLICELFAQMGMKKNLPSFPPDPFRACGFKAAFSSLLFCSVKCVQQMHKTEVWEGTSQINPPGQIPASPERSEPTLQLLSDLSPSQDWLLWNIEVLTLPGLDGTGPKDSLIYTACLAVNSEVFPFLWLISTQLSCNSYH